MIVDSIKGSNLNSVKSILRQFKHVHRLPFLYFNQFLSPEIVTLGGIKIKTSSYMSSAIRERIYMGLYESNELKIIKSKLGINDTVMEIGTGLGLLSSYCAKKVGNERVYSYEANPSLEEHIRENYAINEVRPNLTMCAVGTQVDELDFYIGKHFWSASTIPWKPGLKSIKVEVRAFNDEVKKLDPSFLIMDIEGGELEVIQNSDLHNIRKILIEVHPEVIGQEGIEAIISKLEKDGFDFNSRISHKICLFFER